MTVAASPLNCFLVGGAVRDMLLGLAVVERDWVVVGSSPEQMQSQGFTQVGKDFPVFLHPRSHEEYALARTERKSGHGYGGFSFHTDAGVTLEEDLKRRDLTVNAMAQDANGNLIDPYNGRADLDARILRHVSPAFVEDPLRVLRIARFSARFHHLGFSIAPETQTLMKQLVDSGEIAHLVAERVWKETSRALLEANPEIYFRTLNDCGALPVLFPEIAALDGVPQPAKHHPEIDTLEHLYLCLAKAADHDWPLAVRFAVLCHDLGKGTTAAVEWPHHHGHERRGVKLTEQLGKRLAVPRELITIGKLTAEYHTHCHRALELTPQTLIKLFKALDTQRRPQRLDVFLKACQADSQGRLGRGETPYPQADFLATLATALSVDTQPLQERGLVGREFGKAIHHQQLSQLSKARQSWLKQHS